MLLSRAPTSNLSWRPRAGLSRSPSAPRSRRRGPRGTATAAKAVCTPDAARLACSRVHSRSRTSCVVTRRLPVRGCAMVEFFCSRWLSLVARWVRLVRPVPPPTLPSDAPEQGGRRDGAGEPPAGSALVVTEVALSSSCCPQGCCCDLHALSEWTSCHDGPPLVVAYTHTRQK